MTLGEVLDGDRMAVSQYDVKFKGNHDMLVISVSEAFKRVHFQRQRCWRLFMAP